LIALPFILAQNSWFEWANALWLLDLQTAHVAAHAIPTFFIDAPEQYFYPQNVFYAGPALSVLAYPSLLIGTWAVFAIVTACAFIAASAGIGWTARNLGVPARLAILPGVLFAMTPYLVSDLYGRGAWTELVAVGGLAVALGAATSLTTGRARSPRTTVAVLALAVACVAGTHNVTLLFAAAIALPLALVLLPLLQGERRELIKRHLLVLGGSLVGVALCGVFLAPDVWLSGSTYISSLNSFFLHQLHPFETFSIVFTPFNALPAGTASTDLHTQTLVTPLAWIAGVAAVSLWRRRVDQRTALALAGLLALGIVLTVLAVDPSWWLSFPGFLRSIQFPFRLVTYISLLTVLGVIVLLALPAVRSNRVAVLVLWALAGWQLALAVDLAITAKARGAETAPTHDNVSATSVPPAFQYPNLQPTEFRLIPAHSLATPSQMARVAAIGDDTPTTILLSGTQAPGTLVGTSVVASPLVRFTGDVRLAGSTRAGFSVLRVNSDAPTPWRATAASVCSTCASAVVGDAPLPLLAGRVATLLACLVLLWLVGASALRRWTSRAAGRPNRRRRKSRRESSSPA
jgi:hypothetical protein